MSVEKRYLGDGVYAEVKEGMIYLTTENGIEAQNTVVMDPDILDKFSEFVWDANLGKRPR